MSSIFLKKIKELSRHGFFSAGGRKKQELYLLCIFKFECKKSLLSFKFKNILL